MESGVVPDVLESTIQLPPEVVLDDAVQFNDPVLADTATDWAAGLPPVELAKLKEVGESVRLALEVTT